MADNVRIILVADDFTSPPEFTRISTQIETRTDPSKDDDTEQFRWIVRASRVVRMCNVSDIEALSTEEFTVSALNGTWQGSPAFDLALNENSVPEWERNARWLLTGQVVTPIDVSGSRLTQIEETYLATTDWETLFTG